MFIPAQHRKMLLFMYETNLYFPPMFFCHFRYFQAP